MNPNRHKSERPRHPSDFYETPPELALAAIKYLWSIVVADGFNFWFCNPVQIVDAGAGNGVWGEQLHRSVKGLENGIYLTGVELEHRPDAKLLYYDEWHETDYLTWESDYRVDMVIGNPPFSLGAEFVRHSYDMLVDTGFVLFLLRQGFIGSKTRQFGLYKECKLRRFVVLTRRPSFFSTVDGRKTTDMIDYALFIFQKGWKGGWTGDWLYWNYDKEN